MILPKFRTEEYTIWSACERLGILPPRCKTSWDSCDVYAQASIIAYSLIRSTEGAE